MANTLTRTVGLRLIVLVLLAAFNSIAAYAQERISIIPQPRDLKTTGEIFRIDKNTHIALADARSVDDKFAAEEFIEDLKNTASISLNINPKHGRNAIVVGLLTQPTIQQSLKAS